MALVNESERGPRDARRTRAARSAGVTKPDARTKRPASPASDGAKSDSSPSEPRAAKGTAERIFDAAEELFCERGFDGVSVRDIAERAGVQKALVFYHFATKEELFDEVLARYYQAHRRALEGALSAPLGVRERLHGMIDAYLDFMASSSRYARLVQAQLSNPVTHPLVEKSFTPLYRFVEDALAEIAPREGRASARQLFVTFMGSVIGWCTYAPLLSHVWRADPLGAPLLEERRAHLAWLADLLADALTQEPREPPHQSATPPRRSGARKAPAR